MTRYTSALAIAQTAEYGDVPLAKAEPRTQIIYMRRTYPAWLRALGVLTVLLLAFGAVAGTIWPGPITGLGVPIGLTLWYAVAKVADKRGRIVLR